MSASTTSTNTNTIAELQQAVRGQARLLPRGSGTKPTLSRCAAGVKPLDMHACRGIVEYDPGEFTFTALAGTPLREITAMLAEHGQYLPFDPPLVDSGATLGGTIAAGLSGPGRLRFGGLRDFILGVRIITGDGELVRGGGKVVKNAAGFDLPKLMVGSAGRLGAIVEATFKVFPAPEAARTLRIACRGLDDAVATLCRLTREPWDLDALELEPPQTLVVRLAGDRAALGGRCDRLINDLGRACEGVAEADAERYWADVRELRWGGAAAAAASAVGDANWVKVALTPRRIAPLDAALAAHDVTRRYSVAGNMAWVVWPQQQPIQALDTALQNHGLAAVVVDGPVERVYLGQRRGGAFIERVQRALDPAGKFAGLG